MSVEEARAAYEATCAAWLTREGMIGATSTVRSETIDRAREHVRGLLRTSTTATDMPPSYAAAVSEAPPAGVPTAVVVAPEAQPVICGPLTFDHLLKVVIMDLHAGQQSKLLGMLVAGDCSLYQVVTNLLKMAENTSDFAARGGSWGEWPQPLVEEMLLFTLINAFRAIRLEQHQGGILCVGMINLYLNALPPTLDVIHVQTLMAMMAVFCHVLSAKYQIQSLE